MCGPCREWSTWSFCLSPNRALPHAVGISDKALNANNFTPALQSSCGCNSGYWSSDTVWKWEVCGWCSVSSGPTVIWWDSQGVNFLLFLWGIRGCYFKSSFLFVFSHWFSAFMHSFEVHKLVTYGPSQLWTIQKQVDGRFHCCLVLHAVVVCRHLNVKGGLQFCKILLADLSWILFYGFFRCLTKTVWVLS